MPDSTLAPSPAGAGGFSLRGFHLDLRVQVMTPAALHRLADELKELGYNALVMEWEASFPYRRHATISHDRTYSPKEVRAFLRHCRDLGLTVMPLQASLGHMEHILRHPRYAHLREDDGNRCQLCPRKIDAGRALLRELLLDLRDYHDGPWIHLGGDEAYLLGHCPDCREFAKTNGLSALYVEFMAGVLADAKAAGWKPVIWADMLLKHPESMSQLPRDTVLIDWNYGWARERFGDPRKLIEAGFTVWGSPALRSSPDNHSLTWWERHLNNFRDFIPQGRREGYSAMILTSWSTSGMFGYSWDENFGGRVLDLWPIRRVYPLNGHRLLLAACSRALDQAAPLAPAAFLREYGEARFGLSARDSSRFATALLHQNPDYRARPAAQLLAALQPRRNRAEFAHLGLIEAFHQQQGGLRRLEARYQKSNYTRSQAAALHRQAGQLERHSQKLEREFRRLQRNYLHPAEIGLERSYRCATIANLAGSSARQAAP